MQPTWLRLIDRRTGKLRRRCPELIRIRVTLKSDRRRLYGAEAVTINAHVPGGTLRVGKQQELMTDALHAAFDALERKLGERNR